jgi:hypothetical protein
MVQVCIPIGSDTIDPVRRCRMPEAWSTEREMGNNEWLRWENAGRE